MNVTICTIGELLVEFLAKEENQGFSRPGEFWGPYPSGAPAIFADQVAKLGFGSVLFSCVGNDAFGEMNIARLEKDGVNVNGIAMLQKATTGSAFVSYRSQAQRDFIFNMPNSACGLLTADHIDEALLNQCQHFHIMGSSLFSFRIIDAMRKAIENIKGRNGTVSFDPNIRKEMLNIPEMSQAFEYILDYTDIFLPSDGELDYFGLNPERNEQILVDKLLKRGVKHVVIKRGPRGASYFSANETHHVAGLNVPVVDPTGAGDCFGATFVSLFLNGATPQEALRWANASGSLAISQRGPMEGTSTQAQIRAFLAAQHP
ncbi:TPA: sugar kinase [Klebsiella pneumoniae]|uniref:sugar kinase n=1 Tax=Klebsiella pneumoniae TaxID=573 RepID=UPI0024A81F75|nr:sugar kinase [Klebsiella pneumoniae]HDT1625934.1 sugar kinase [Klebsiella pneumoniae subsp. ozaenae]HEO9194819.1 sugar kinase [Klebsiella pneumoniae subsp. pneumoniae]EKJ5233544.1 sugar kinase [Klebsiella pneumoniae]EKV7526185.1 sugar kinase [Klebsiella pneumoniae]EKW8852813.1 sugar kinase [Klebsiella pneumoniae]